MKSTIFFIFSLFLINFNPVCNVSTQNNKAILSEEILTDDELINFPLEELKNDCDTLQLFGFLIKKSISEKKNDLEKLHCAITTIKEAKILVLKIINIEKQLETCDDKSSNFLMKREKSKQNIDFQESQLSLSQSRKDFDDVIDKLNEIYDLVSEECQQDMEDLDELLGSDVNEDEHTENIKKYKKVIKLMKDVIEILKDGVQKMEYIKDQLAFKKDEADLLMNDNYC